MADDKEGRDKQAQDEERRQRERELETALERGDEPEPPVEPASLAEVEAKLESQAFPATGTEIVATVGDHVIETATESYAVEELVPATDGEQFEEPAAVRTRIQRPTVASAMKRVLEAAETLPNTDVSQSQRDAYERTFRALEDVDETDENEGVRAVSDWVVERIRENEKLPGSRDIRRQGAKVSRERGYEVRNDEWLGI